MLDRCCCCELLVTLPSIVKWISNDLTLNIHAQKCSPSWVYAYRQRWLELSCTLASLRITPIKYSILDQYESQLNELCMLLVIQQQTASKGFSLRFKCFAQYVKMLNASRGKPTRHPVFLHTEQSTWSTVKSPCYEKNAGLAKTHPQRRGSLTITTAPIPLIKTRVFYFGACGPIQPSDF